MMLPVIEKNRLKIYRLGYLELLTAVQMRGVRDGYLQWPVVSGIPEDAKVHHVFHDPNSRCYNVVVSHESFPEVAEFAEIPCVDDSLCFQMQVLKVIGDAAMADMGCLTTEQLQYIRDEAIRLLSQRTL